MATLTGILAGIGTAVTGGAASGGTAVAIGGLTAATTLTSTGLGIAQAAGAFDPEPPDIDAAPKQNEAKRRLDRLASTEPTLLAGESGLEDTPILGETLLGPSSSPPRSRP